jgi:AcrR family transcriptional regulator
MEKNANSESHGPRWRRRKDARPAEILTAALEAFTEHGYESSRLEDIARRAGCTKGTIFLYYESKAELFKAVVRTVMVPLLTDIETAIREHEGSSRELLARLLRMRWDRQAVSRLSGLAKLLFAETDRYPELARFYYEEIHAKNQALLKQVLDRGVERGEFRPLDTASVARISIAPVVLAGIWKHSFGPVLDRTLDTDEHFGTLLDVLFSGIQAVPVAETADH